MNLLLFSHRLIKFHRINYFNRTFERSLNLGDECLNFKLKQHLNEQLLFMKVQLKIDFFLFLK